jgi:hypothetical protein
MSNSGRSGTGQSDSGSLRFVQYTRHPAHSQFFFDFPVLRMLQKFIAVFSGPL